MNRQMEISYSTVQQFFLITVLKKYDYIFAENGLVAYKDGKSVASEVWYM
jgi:Eukaryotic phosphomannomutase.